MLKSLISDWRVGAAIWIVAEVVAFVIAVIWMRAKRKR